MRRCSRNVQDDEENRRCANHVSPKIRSWGFFWSMGRGEGLGALPGARDIGCDALQVEGRVWRHDASRTAPLEGPCHEQRRAARVNVIIRDRRPSHPPHQWRSDSFFCSVASRRFCAVLTWPERSATFTFLPTPRTTQTMPAWPLPNPLANVYEACRRGGRVVEGARLESV